VRGIVLLLSVLVALPALSNTFEVTGRVIGPKGEPVASAKVFLSQNRRAQAAATNRNGQYAIDGVQVGEVTIIAYASGYGIAGFEGIATGPGDVNLQLSEAKPLIIDALEPAIKAEGAVAQPVVGAQIDAIRVLDGYSLYLSDLAELGFPNPRSDNEGRLTINFLPDGAQVALTMSARDYAPEGVPYYIVGGPPLTTQLIPGRTVRGRVTDHNGTGVEHARVSVVPDRSDFIQVVTEAVTDPEGYFRTILRPGPYLLAAYHGNHAPSVPVSVEVPEDDPVENVKIELPDACEITGRVHDAKGKAVPGILVQFLHDDVIWTNAYSDTDGTFLLPSPKVAGDIRIIADTGRMLDPPQDVPVDATAAAIDFPDPFILIDLPVLRGVVQDRDGEVVEGAIIVSEDLVDPVLALTNAAGEFEIELTKVVAQRSVTLRVEHPRRLQQKTVEIKLKRSKPTTVKLESFDPNISECEPENSPNDLSALRGQPASPLFCEGAFNLDDALLEDEKEGHRLDPVDGKVMVVTFWGGFDTSPGARLRVREAQILHELFSEVDDVLVVGVHDGASLPSDVEAFIEEWGLTFPVIHDIEATTFDLYDIFAIPQTVLIDKKGVLRFYDVNGRLLELVKALRRE
jgi:hypothetical protein